MPRAIKIISGRQQQLRVRGSGQETGAGAGGGM